MIFWLTAGPFSLLVAWLDRQLLEQRKRQRQTTNDMDELQRQVSGAVQLNKILVHAEDEQQLIEQSLEVFSGVAKAIGATFMPLDEWGQPLQPYAFGQLPEPVLKGWAEHLLSHSIRKQCRHCEALHALSGNECPLMVNPFGAHHNIYCFPVWRSERMIGMLNLYIPPEQDFPEALKSRLQSWLEEFALTIEAIRLRNQERATLSHLQLGRATHTDLESLLYEVMESVQNALKVDAVLLDVRSSGTAFPGLHLERGNCSLLEISEVNLIFQAIYSNPERAPQFSCGGELQSILVVPLQLPGGHVVGVLLTGRVENRDFTIQERDLLTTIAMQMASLIESERSRVTLELRSVLQERIRLAREIHDGFAQTLAFLKLNAAQMQTYLARHDLERLDQALRTSYKALSEAYLDTRQVIDHLRVSPAQGVEAWMEQICDEFEQASGLIVERTCEPGLPELSQEVQSQLMRVVQEAFTNIRKHANASQVKLRLSERHGDIWLEVQDDGEGFLPDDVPFQSRHGLRGMQERAELMGADFQIISQPSAGTTVRLRLPGEVEEKN